MIRKTLVICVLGLLLYNAVGFIIRFRTEINAWHREVKQVLRQKKDSDLERFVFAKNEFNLHTHEFIHNNHFYDVARIEDKGSDSLIVYAYDDTKEKHLYTDFNKNFSKKTDSDRQNTQKEWAIWKYIATPAPYFYANSRYFSIKELIKIDVATDAPLFPAHLSRQIKPPQFFS